MPTGYLNAGPALGDVVGLAVRLVGPRPRHAPAVACVEEGFGRVHVAVVQPPPWGDWWSWSTTNTKAAWSVWFAACLHSR